MLKKLIISLLTLLFCSYADDYIPIDKFGKYHYRILNTKTLDTIYKYDYDTNSYAFYDSTYKRYIDTSITTLNRYSNGSLDYLEHFVISNYYYKLEQMFYYGVGSNSRDKLSLYKYEITKDSINYLCKYAFDKIITERHFTIINTKYDKSSNTLIIDYSTPNPLQYKEIKHYEPINKTVIIDFTKL